VVDVTNANFDLIPRPTIRRFNCQECFYWIGKKDGRLDQKAQKKKWLLHKGAGLGSLSKVLLVDGEDSPVGFIQFGPVKEFETAKLLYPQKSGFPKDGWCITCLTIRPDWRRQGLAQALVREVLKDLQKRGVGCVDVYPPNKTASINETASGTVSLWQKLGFAVFAEGSREVIMRKEFHHGRKNKTTS